MQRLEFVAAKTVNQPRAQRWAGIVPEGRSGGDPAERPYARAIKGI